MTIATVGITLGTVVGSRVMRQIPEIWFQRILVLILTLLGVTMVMRALGREV